MIKGQDGMRRRIFSLLVWVGLVWIAAAPVYGSCKVVNGETICGRVDGLRGDCDGPGTPCNAGSGFAEVYGFAMASTGVERVEIKLESVQFPGEVFTLGRAIYGSARPDAAEEYPGFPGEPFFGWSYNINSPMFANGLYDVWARVITVGGASKELPAQQFLFTNHQSLLQPFGEIERPAQNRDVFGTCTEAFCGDGICEIGLAENCLNCPADCNGQELGAFDDFCCGYGAGRNQLGCFDRKPPPFPGGPSGARVCRQAPFSCSEERQIRYTVVSGWALDLGMNEEDTGIAWVELETNGSIVGNTRTSCEFNSRTGGLTNCYGLPRNDLETRFPFAFDAPSAGYRFVLDVGGMLNADLVTPGSNELIVRAGDWADQYEDIDRVSVNFLCAEDFAEEAFGEIEAPHDGRLYTGLLTFQGWALDGEGVDRVDLLVDGVLIAELSDGMAVDGMGNPAAGGYASDVDDPDGEVDYGTRPVVAENYPGYPNTPGPVWKLKNFDTNTLTNGLHTLQVRVTDDEGVSNFIGEVTFRVDNTPFALLGLYK